MRALMDGSEAIALGAVHAGCDFFAGYPITPASSILHHMMELLPPLGGVAVQGEDEIASIGFCIGAAMTGARAMTATSGPGLSLYSENLGLAVMGEVPLVVVDVQRMGPATGGATTTAEGDVQFARWVTSGGYPMVVYAASDPADAYRLAIESFRTAERLRTPVVLLSSKELAMTSETVELDDFERVPVARRVPGEGPPYAVGRPEDVPGFLPFGGERPTRLTGSIHDEHGVITTDPETIEWKLKHLARKIDSRVEELAMTRLEGRGGARALVVAYGASARAAREAARRDPRLSLLLLRTLWPVPERAIREAAAGVARVVVPELNPGAYVGEIRKLGIPAVSITRIDGGLIEPERILEEALG